MSKSADRAVEFNNLLSMQGHATRSMKYGWQPSEAEQATINARGKRLVELAELLPGAEIDARAKNVPFNPEQYVNERIAAWLKANPLALGTRLVGELVDKVGPNGTVSVAIGDLTKGGYYYLLHADDLTERNGQMVLTVPESVAEHFRKQGERRLQRALADLLALKSHI